MNPDDSIATRQSLLERIKDRSDAVSWQDFFNTYWRLIYNVAMKAGLTDAESQDIVQETVLSVSRNIEGFSYDPSVCSFKTWMLQVTSWRIQNQYKRRAREHLHVHSVVEESTRTSTIERVPDPASLKLDEVWDEEWRKNTYECAMERVKQQVRPHQFQIYDLYVHEEAPVSKVAEALGVSVAKVYLTKHRISRLLRQEIRRIEAQKRPL